LQITERDPGSSNTMYPVHFQLLVYLWHTGGMDYESFVSELRKNWYQVGARTWLYRV